jgi:hypothetical protein
MGWAAGDSGGGEIGGLLAADLELGAEQQQNLSPGATRARRRPSTVAFSNRRKTLISLVAKSREPVTIFSDQTTLESVKRTSCPTTRGNLLTLFLLQREQLT